MIDFKDGHSARYKINVENLHGVTRRVVSVDIDGMLVTHSSGIPLIKDGSMHSTRVVLE